MKFKILYRTTLVCLFAAPLAMLMAPPVHPQFADMTITASPNPVVLAQGQTTGTTTLTWDGGPQHPYAEVWVKVDGNDETFIVESGKGKRDVPIELGKSYLFKLSDANELLASVTVTAKTQSSSSQSRNDENGTILNSKNRHKIGSPALPKPKPTPAPKGPTAPEPTTRSEIVRLDILSFYVGDEFEYVCGPQRVLVGLRAYTGTMVDNVQAICATVGFQTIEDAKPEGPVFGGADGQSNNGFSCPSQKIAAKLAVRMSFHHPIIGAITFGCLDFSTGQWVDKGIAAGDRVELTKDQSCPADTVAVGIRGIISHSNPDYISGLGLICAGPTAP